MRNKIILVVLLFVIVFSPVALSCSSLGSTAKGVAKEWTGDADNVVFISNDLAELVIENIPGVNPVQQLNLKNQIAGKLFWNYSEATELAENSYSVTATAAVSILNIPLVGIFGISADYQLTIDTAEQEVSDWTLVTGSFESSSLQNYEQ